MESIGNIAFFLKAERIKKYGFGIFLAMMWLVVFWQPLLGKGYTSWDTHDLGFVNFLYFSDSLRDGIVPLWNNLIQGGTFFPTLNNIGLFTPFQLVFVAISWVVNPVYAYELLIQSAVFVGAFGCYRLAKENTGDELASLFCAIAYCLAVLLPIVGQISFVFSLGSLPWLILMSVRLIEGHHNRISKSILCGAFTALYITSGYPWMNFINVTMTVIFSFVFFSNKFLHASGDERKALMSRAIHFGIFISFVAFLYCALMLPGLLSIKFNYSNFLGDYISAEPRLRGLVATQHYAYGDILKALVAAIDPRIYIDNPTWATSVYKWSLGAGWVVWICAFVFTKERYSWHRNFWRALTGC